MKLNKEELIELMYAVGTEFGSYADKIKAEAIIKALKDNDLEIDGYCKLDDHEKDLIYALRNIKIKRIKANEPEGWVYLLDDRRVVRTEISIKIEGNDESDCESVLSSLEEIKFQQKTNNETK